MNASAHIVDIDEGNAQQWLIEESQQRPVVVDFWADWCAPCKQLMPLLEKLANEYAGAFLLAKVNADDISCSNSGETDGLAFTRPCLPLSAINRHRLQITVKRVSDHLPHAQRCA